MCSIHGFTFYMPGLAERMVSSARHRGPDGEGYFSDGNITLAHNLLAITESPENARQPWQGEEGRYVLSYNGEVYNYIDLRSGLEEKGAVFKTDSDTEVLFHGLRIYGIRFLDQIDGMFGIAWYDKQDRKLLIARDRSGMKPLYYRIDDSGLCFSSELSAVLCSDKRGRRLDPVAASLYLSLGYVPGERTLVEGTLKLAPGEWLQYDVQGQSTAQKGTIIQGVPEPTEMPDIGTYRSTMQLAVKRCLSGRRTFGLNLSGGMDSTSMLHEASELGYKVKTFTTRFSGEGNIEKYNEDADMASELSKIYGTEHEEIIVNANNFVDAMEPAVSALEEPHGNKNLPAYYLHMKGVARAGTVVILGGEGGDEILCGYGRYRGMSQIDSIFSTNSNGEIDFSAARKVAGFRKTLEVLLNRGSGHPSFVGMQRRIGKNYFKKHLLLGSRVSPIDYWFLSTKIPGLRELVLSNSYKINDQKLMEYCKDWMGEIQLGTDSINNEMFLEGLNWLAEEALIRSDKLGMTFGMEARFPFLVRPLRKYCLRIPSAEKMSQGKAKAMQKEAYRGVLPDKIIDKKKTGWSAPSVEWRNSSPLKDALSSILSKEYYKGTSNFFDFDKITSAMHPVSQYTLAYLQIWMRQNKVTA